MITCDFVKTMARYNQWQNQSLYNAASKLSDQERRQDRGAFFKSIHLTLSHLMWGDMIWTSRFANLSAPEVSPLNQTPVMIADWEELKAKREQRDLEIIAWSKNITAKDLSGNLAWFSGLMNKSLERPMTEILVQFFNHQTHHRGQVHAMITAAGGVPDDTDLILMPVS